MHNRLDLAARAIRDADALLIGAGAGMGVDSGLPDFRGPQGFWKAYPAYEKLGLNFSALANPCWFAQDPELAWGFYGHRLNLYRKTTPHAGFANLKRWGRQRKHGYFVFTSNVDGQFQRAQFELDRIYEVHGAIDWMQCTRDCGIGLFESGRDPITVDETTMRARAPLPACPECGALARPNILMFGDYAWDERRTAEQRTRLQAWFDSLRGARLAVVECGAGKGIPTVRHFCEHVIAQFGGTLIRINVRESDVASGHIGLPMGALAALEQIDALTGQ